MVPGSLLTLFNRIALRKSWKQLCVCHWHMLKSKIIVKIYSLWSMLPALKDNSSTLGLNVYRRHCVKFTVLTSYLSSLLKEPQVRWDVTGRLPQSDKALNFASFPTEYYATSISLYFLFPLFFLRCSSFVWSRGCLRLFHSASGK